MSISIRFGRIEDTEAIMQFMDRHWRRGHILSRCRDLLLYEFAERERINFALAWRNDRLVGLFGFIKYNRRPIPDLAGSLWKVTETEKSPLLGMKLRQFVIDNVPHRFFSAPGAGPQTKPIYQVIGMNWARMSHWFMLNQEMDKLDFRLAKFDGDLPISQKKESVVGRWSVRKVEDDKELKRFPFEKFDNTLPFKDAEYVRHRFFNYPIYDYQVWHVQGGHGQALYVTRLANHGDACALRMVDYYGDEECLPAVGTALHQQMRNSCAEYVDFVSFGFPQALMSEAGFLELDLDDESIIIPNYFEPFERRNVPVYCVFDPVPNGFEFRMCKADGDQDRPNSK